MAIKKPDDRLITHYGRMNRISKPLMGPVIDADESSTIEVLTEMAKERHMPDVFASAGPYRAQVLRIEERRRPESGVDPDTPEHDIFVREGKDKSVFLVRVKARIPELHAGLPIPSGLGDADGDFQKIIDMYPSFTAASDDIALADLAVGDPVWVDFVDKLNYKDGVLLSSIKKSSGGSSGVSESASQSRDGACAGTYGSQGGVKPTGDSLPMKNKPKSHSGAPLRRRRSANIMTGEFVFIEDSHIPKKIIKLWEKSAKAHAPSGKSSWSLLSDFATLVYKPNVTDLSHPKEYIWLFPPEETRFNIDTFDSVARTCFELATEGRNYILIMVLPNPPDSPSRRRRIATKDILERAEGLIANDNEDAAAEDRIVQPAATPGQMGVQLSGGDGGQFGAAEAQAGQRFVREQEQARLDAAAIQGYQPSRDDFNLGRPDLSEHQQLPSRVWGHHDSYSGDHPVAVLDPSADGFIQNGPVVVTTIPNLGTVTFMYDNKLWRYFRPGINLMLPIEFNFVWVNRDGQDYGPFDWTYYDWIQTNIEAIVHGDARRAGMPPMSWQQRVGPALMLAGDREIPHNHSPVQAPGVLINMAGLGGLGSGENAGNEGGESPVANAAGVLEIVGAMDESEDENEPFPGPQPTPFPMGGTGLPDGAAGPAGAPNSPVFNANNQAPVGADAMEQVRAMEERGFDGTWLGRFILRTAARRRTWLGEVSDKLENVFSANRKEKDFDTYVSIGSGAYSLQTVPFGLFGAHSFPRRINMIKPVGNFHPIFVSQVSNLALLHTEEIPEKGEYSQFDLNLIIESKAFSDVTQKIRIEAQNFIARSYLPQGDNKKLPPVFRGLAEPLTLAERWVTIFEQPQIRGMKYVGYSSPRHVEIENIPRNIHEPSGDVIAPANNIEEQEENDVEDAAQEPEARAASPRRQPPEDPPSVPPPTSPSARGKSSFTPKRAARVVEAERFKQNRVKIKDYGSIGPDKERNLLKDVPNTKGPGKVKLHVLAAARFEALRSAAAQAGFPDVRLASGFRKHRWRSREQYERRMIEKYGSVKEGRKWMAYQSPHETGLAFDFGNHGMSPSKSRIPQMKRAPFYKWLKDNAHKFGLTPYTREPWHWECRIPYNAWAAGKEFAEGGVEGYAVRVLDVGSKDIAIGDTSQPVQTAVASNSPSPDPCVGKVGGAGSSSTSSSTSSTVAGSTTGRSRAAGSGSRRETVPGSGASQGKQAPTVPHPQDKFTIIPGSPCNGCHRRMNKLTELFVLHETGGNPNTTEELQRRRWAKHNGAGGRLDRSVHLWQGSDGKFMQESPLEQNLPHANTLNRWSFGVEVASFSVDAASYGGPASKVMKGLHVIGDPNHKVGRESDIMNPNTHGYRYRAIQIPQEIQFEKIWQFVLWATTTDVPSSSGTTIDIPMNFPGLGSDGRFYFSAMGYGEPVPTVKEGAAYKWSREAQPRGIMAHARVHHADGLPFEYYCIQRAKGVDRTKAFYSTIGALCSMDKKKGVELMAPDNYAQLGLELYPWQLNHPTRYHLGKTKWAALDKTKYGLSIA